MAYTPNIPKCIAWFAAHDIKEERARAFLGHYGRIGWDKVYSVEKAALNWVYSSCATDHISYVSPKAMTPNEPLARGQPTFAANRVEPPRELTDEEKAERAHFIAVLKAEPIAPLLVSLRQKAERWKKHPSMVPGMTKELYNRVMRYDEAIRRLRIKKEEYL